MQDFGDHPGQNVEPIELPTHEFETGAVIFPELSPRHSQGTPSESKEVFTSHAYPGAGEFLGGEDLAAVLLEREHPVEKKRVPRLRSTPERVVLGAREAEHLVDESEIVFEEDLDRGVAIREVPVGSVKGPARPHDICPIQDRVLRSREGHPVEEHPPAGLAPRQP